MGMQIGCRLRLLLGIFVGAVSARRSEFGHQPVGIGARDNQKQNGEFLQPKPPGGTGTPPLQKAAPPPLNSKYLSYFDK